MRREVKWIEGVFEKESKSSDFPTIILDLSKALAELLCCHKEALSSGQRSRDHIN